MGLPVFLYRSIIDPLLRSVRREIDGQILKNSSVIDIASGTGTLLFSLAGKCSRLVGIDLDERMVVQAEHRRARRDIPHLEFYQEDGADLSRFREKEFDFAVLSMAVHQFDPGGVDGIIDEARRVAAELIIADYTIPYPETIYGRISFMVERMAGKEHFSNYLHYTAGNGLPGLIGKHNLSPRFDRMTTGGIFHIYRFGSS